MNSECRMNPLAAYIPQDRCHALACGTSLPDRTGGAALFADISGFTPLTDALRLALGPRQDSEALTDQINTTRVRFLRRRNGVADLNCLPAIAIALECTSGDGYVIQIGQFALCDAKPCSGTGE